MRVDLRDANENQEAFTVARWFDLFGPLESSLARFGDVGIRPKQLQVPGLRRQDSLLLDEWERRC